MRRLKIVGVVILITVVLVVAAVAVIFLDLASYTATGNQTLNASGSVVGHALVVYDPGLSGSAQKAAEKIAVDLQQMGYTVNLAGVRSGAAGTTTGYDIVVAGGPMYGGRATSSIEAFFKGLAPQQHAALGAFVTTGSSQYVESDYLSFQQQLKSVTGNPVSAQMVLDGNETQNCAHLVSSLMPTSTAP